MTSFQENDMFILSFICAFSVAESVSTHKHTNKSTMAEKHTDVPKRLRQWLTDKTRGSEGFLDQVTVVADF